MDSHSRKGNSGNLSDSFRAGKKLGMKGERERIQIAQQRWSRRVEVLVRNAIDTSIARTPSSMPVAVLYNFLQGHAVSRSAPGSDEDLRIHAGDLLGGNLLSRHSEKFATCGLNQLRNPGLGGYQRPAPLFAKNRG